MEGCGTTVTGSWGLSWGGLGQNRRFWAFPGLLTENGYRVPDRSKGAMQNG